MRWTSATRRASIPALLAQPKRSALLAYLILAHRGSFCRRDTLLALFWPELDDQAGRRALNQALSFLRRHLPDGVLTTRGTEEVGVDAVQVRSDVQAFEAAVAADDWAEAVAHYHGELLEGLHVAGAAAFTDWVDRERERLREAASGAAWKHAHALIAEGRQVDAERAGQLALRLVPTDESAVRGFIRALAEGGERAGALRFYERFASVLEQELEVEPARETRAVAERIRSGEVVVNLRTPPPEVVTPLPFPPVAQPTPPRGVRPAQAQPLEASRRWWTTLMIGGALVAVAAAAVIAYVALRPDPLDIIVTDIRPITVEPGVEFLPAISPGGRDVAFASGGQIVVRSVGHVPGQGEVRLGDPSPSTALAPSWTPDGSLVHFISCARDGRCRWVTAPRTGGAMIPLELPAGVPTGMQDLAWSPDGSRVALFRGDTLFVASTRDGGTVLWSRDVRATSAVRTWGFGNKTGMSPDGSTLYSTGGHEDGTGGLWAVGDRGRGEPRLVVAFDRPKLGAGWMSIGNERVYLTVGTTESDVWVATVKR